MGTMNEKQHHGQQYRHPYTSAMKAYSIIEGEDFEFEADDGVMLVLDDGSGAPVRETAAGGAGVVVANLRAGRYWLAVRTSSGLQRAGTLDVAPLADQTELTLRREVADLDREIAKLDELMTFQRASGSTGLNTTRSQLGSVRRQRARAEARLGSYLARAEGLDPVRRA